MSKLDVQRFAIASKSRFCARLCEILVPFSIEERSEEGGIVEERLEGSNYVERGY
jgi:hypothetical protein